MSNSQGTGVCDGLLIVETASVLAGPLVGQFFAELGATVIKVENPRCGGDVTRHWRLPSEAEPNTPDPDKPPTYFSATNWGKQSVALDLSKPAQRDALVELLQRADLWLDNLRPGADCRLGLDPEAIRGANPRLIRARVTAYGESDQRGGYDAALQAETGFMALNADSDGRPKKFPLALVDVLTAHQLKEAALLALWERDRTGVGRDVTVSLRDGGLSVWANQAANWLVARHKPRPQGSDHPTIVPYGTVFDCTDGQPLVLAVGTDAQFAALVQTLEIPGLAEDVRFADNESRVVNREELKLLLAPAIAVRERSALLAAFETIGVPASAVRNLEEALEDPQNEHLLHTSGSLRGLRTAVFEGFGGSAQGLQPPPAMGADTTRVLRDLLGWDSVRIQDISDAD